jgi:hypothetical protein
MYHTKTQRKKIAKAFKLVLAYLPNTTGAILSPYICDGLCATSDYYSVQLAKDVINDRIDDAFSVEDWLEEQSDAIADEVRYDVLCNDGRKLQAYRKAWLQSLITEFGG